MEKKSQMALRDRCDKDSDCDVLDLWRPKAKICAICGKKAKTSLHVHEIEGDLIDADGRIA